jgi:hypothetical protein
MRSRRPTSREIAELVAFLPRLTADGFEPVLEWRGGRGPDGVIEWPYPDYDPVVREFFAAASRDCWSDYGDGIAEAADMLKDEARVRSADLDAIKMMLTFCVRGERFCGGHWANVLRAGHIRRLLQRLAELAPERDP